MDIWHGLFALMLMGVGLRFYMWCQMCYWNSPEWQDSKERPTNGYAKKCEDNEDA